MASAYSKLGIRLVACGLLTWSVNLAGCSDRDALADAQGATAGTHSAGTPAGGGAGAAVPTAGAPVAGSSGTRAAALAGAGASAAGAGAAGQAGTDRAGAGAGGSGGAGAVAMPVAGATATAGASAGAGEGAGAGGTGGAATCEKGKVKASEVVIIGESFIAQSGAIPRYLATHAQEAGTIGMSETYRSFAVSGTQLTTGEIPGQYTRAKNAGPVKAILMDGGGNDLLFGGFCTGGPETCSKVVMTVETLFKQMGMDGVKDVVYFFYPDPMGIGANIKMPMDVLRPEMKKLCDTTKDVRCIWVDQRESWEGKYGTFTSDGIHPTDEGAKASAKQIWDAMVANCVAQ